MIYLDHAAATSVDADVLVAMQPYFIDNFYNPSAEYLPAKAVREQLEAARARVAHWLGARPREIIFTAGGTEGNNLAIQGVLRSALSNCSVTVTSIEHDSVLEPAKLFNCFVAFTTEEGRVDLEDLRAKISDDTVLVSVQYANNEIGTIQPVRQISAMLADIRAQRSKNGNDRPLYFHVDACQAGNYLDLHISRLGVDLMTLNGGKIYGPKQSGVVYVANHVQLQPLILGGGQERGLRSGTENVAAAVGFAAALEKTQMLRYDEAARLESLQRLAFRYLAQHLPSAIVNGSKKHRLPNNLHITVPGFDNETLALQLEQAGFMVAVGSACSASSDEPSHVLKAMGLSNEAAQSSLRITMGRTTTQEDIEAFLEALQKLTTNMAVGI